MGIGGTSHNMGISSKVKMYLVFIFFEQGGLMKTTCHLCHIFCRKRTEEDLQVLWTPRSKPEEAARKSVVCIVSMEIKIHEVLWTQSSFQMLREDCWDVIWLTCCGCLSFGNSAVGGERTVPRWVAVMCPNTGSSSLHTPEYHRKEQEPGSVGCVFFGTAVPSRQLHLWGTLVGCIHVVQTTFPAWICPQSYSSWLVISSLTPSPYFYFFSRPAWSVVSMGGLSEQWGSQHGLWCTEWSS